MPANVLRHIPPSRAAFVAWAAGCALLLVSIPLSCALGPLGIAPADSLLALLHSLGLADLPKSAMAALPGGGLRELDGNTLSTVICSMRFPRILLAIAAGAGLAVAGAVFQAILRNPLADSFTLGTSSGAAFGASLAISLGATAAFSGFALPLAAFCGAVVSLFAVLGFSRASGGLGRETLVLAGIVVSAVLAALIALVKALDESSVTGIVFWIMGSFQGRGARELVLVLPGVAGGCFAGILFSRQLDLLFLGDDTARLLGLSAARTRLFMLLVCGLVTASCVAVSGIIGFVGLAVPHLCRMIFGAGHARLLPACALGGGLLLLWSDTLARTILPGGVELPVGVITALLGGPFFCFVLGKSATASPRAAKIPAAMPPRPETFTPSSQAAYPATKEHILCQDLVFSYNRAGLEGSPVLRGINLAVAQGEFVGLLGQNGSGKSTLLRCLCGLEKPDSGKALIRGQAICRMREKERARLLSNLPQRPEEVPALTAFELVLMGRYARTTFLGGYTTRDHNEALAALEAVNGLALAGRPASHLSGGELQRILLARAIAANTPLLVLDEATAGLDPHYQSAVLQTIAQRQRDTGMTVFSAMHDINHASQFCGRIIFLKKGRIVADGPPGQVITPEILRSVYETDFLVLPHPANQKPQVLTGC
ncbi:iron chelate uptake ABC transporter family permease subunit [Desulfovibrio sp. OttesenSCG-928-G15]|nr:iron chelate uptake ABC transporter family permease subunit [Desulfovibrio sp. OttesenSCG-928-G15]